MATITLTDQNISNTYTGILHAQGTILPSSGQVLIYDGDGNSSALRLGRAGFGATISGGLSCNVLSASGIQYPITDGTSGQFLQTNGSGRLTFSSILSTSLPNLSPNPANTYTGISAISVDSKGRVTNVVTAGGGGAALSQTSLYSSPIALLDVTYAFVGDIYAGRPNMPSDSTFVILQIDAHGVFNQSTDSGPIYIYVNNARAAMLGSDTYFRQQNIFHNNVSTLWYAALDGSDNIHIRIETYVVGGFQYRVRFNILGYTNHPILTP